MEQGIPIGSVMIDRQHCFEFIKKQNDSFYVELGEILEKEGRWRLTKIGSPILSQEIFASALMRKIKVEADEPVEIINTTISSRLHPNVSDISKKQELLDDFHKRLQATINIPQMRSFVQNEFQPDTFDSRFNIPSTSASLATNVTQNIFEEQKPIPMDAATSGNFNNSGAQFIETADGGLIPVFGNDDPLPSAVTEEERKAAKRRYDATMRQRKHRAKLSQAEEDKILENYKKIKWNHLNGMDNPTTTLSLPARAIKKELETMGELGNFGEYDLKMFAEASGMPIGKRVSPEYTKRRRAEYQRLKRAMLTEEQKEKIKIQNKERQRALRAKRKLAAMGFAGSTEEMEACMEIRAQQTEYVRLRRAAMSEEEKAKEREKGARRCREKRKNETEEQRQMRRERDAASQRARRHARYAMETAEEKAERKRLQAEKRRHFRAKQSGNSSKTETETEMDENEKDEMDVSEGMEDSQFEETEENFDDLDNGERLSTNELLFVTAEQI